MPADLHLHTHYSDGTFTPQELVQRAAHSGLTTISLTDHDTAEGCTETAAACAQAQIEFIHGTELTTELAGTEFHLLGYGFNPHNPSLNQAFHAFQQGRQDRIREMAERLQQHQIPLSAEEIFALANCRSPGRPHVARALVQKGICSSVDEAFQRFLRRNRPAWTPKTRIAIADAIQLLHQAGGIAVLAHPGINQADPYLETLVEAGLDGIECFHTKHSPTASSRYLQFAQAHQLLITGGSDCHGMAKGNPLIGSMKLDPLHLQPLREAINRRQQATLKPQSH
jgi:predicted metal-dependent phosphoesterase TrpH